MWLRKWKHNANEYGDQIIEASKELKGKNTRYWVLIGGSTLFIWSCRYLLVNALITAYTSVSLSEHAVIFSRQIIMWIVMMISPTPGSSGTAEYFFAQFFDEFLDGYTFVTSIIWRLLSYYPYLLLGAIFLPRWIRQVFFVKKKKKESIN